MLRCDVQRGKQRLQRAAEIVIDNLRYPTYVFFHLCRMPRLRFAVAYLPVFAGAISYTLAAIAAAPSAHNPNIMLTRGTFRTLKIT